MAIQTQSTVSAAVQASAEQLFSRRDEWQWVRNADTGVSFIAMPSLSGERVYHVHRAGFGCNCRAYEVGLFCSHRRAVQLDLAERAAVEIAHQEALAEMIAAPAEPTTVPVRKSYSALFAPICMALGCRDRVTSGSDYCQKCDLSDAF